MYLFALLWVAGESGIALKKGGISVCVCGGSGGDGGEVCM